MMHQVSAVADALRFLRRNWWRVLLVSALVIVPCVWHRHIEAGDLGSHVYNAWLAQLIAKGNAPGLYIAPQWNNILFDVTLVHVANWLGFAAAEKIVVSGCVLIFFWGVFAFVAVVADQPPWTLTPCIAILGYGYSFNMGFMNYYLSIGLACFCLALLWRDRSRNWIPALVIAVLVTLAHPMGLVWVVAVVVYLAIRPVLPGAWKLLVPLVVIAACSALRWYIHHRSNTIVADFYREAPFHATGVDQLVLYGPRYQYLGWAALIIGIVCFALDAVARRKEADHWKRLAIPFELYLILFCTASFAPENLRFSADAAWIGLLVSRLTTISAIVGLSILGGMRPRKWHWAGFALVAAIFFAFLYQDTEKLNRMETHAEALLSTVPAGTRIVPLIFADPDSRIAFIVHLADRACVERCFIYSNYEPSSKQFRIRVAKSGSWIVSASPEDANDMQGGSYEIQQSDLPIKQLYQCDQSDWTQLCLRDFAEGESTGKFALGAGR